VRRWQSRSWRMHWMQHQASSYSAFGLKTHLK
jgi:hypothetical protein